MAVSSTDPLDPLATIADVVAAGAADLIELRRDLHRNPELSWHETRTTALLTDLLERDGWRTTPLPTSGLVAEIGEPDGDRTGRTGRTGRPGSVVALRADIDALPVADACHEPWASTVPGVAHACGHDVHTACLVGAARALSHLHRQGRLPGRVRLLLQPAEEVMPGGAREVIGAGHLDGVGRIFALHCEPTIQAGVVGLRAGALTSAADLIEVRLSGPGGHTSRPHLTADLTFAAAKVVTELPAVLSRRMDPRSGVSVVWGTLRAGVAANVIPEHGSVAGTVRVLDAVAWAGCEAVIAEAVGDIVRPYGVTAEIDYRRGVPPVVNDSAAVDALGAVVDDLWGPEARVGVPQSLGGEDFGWYVEQVPGAMFRLGTRAPGGPAFDLHQGNLRIDERAIAVGAAVLAGAAVRSLVTER